ncbi:hypothetical protein [Aidingimonas halophila]|uniref:DUF2178 domain-containing protein n=1 Tax=Aidingimonas halophila TaxID=574349 RepID=A0A1H2SKL9_9GAMM|nr:hypothetical protein [Aidingimonas halophila]GHC17568.1 hypothetical protein GCM10008094_04000 [Aidingimonas halophila]SDW31609.1 hypothetical protein SAMN05443545_101576 [Aidingimonas halophila]
MISMKKVPHPTADNTPHRPLVVPLVSVMLGIVMFVVSWLAAEAPEIGLAMLIIMLIYAGIMRFGQRFESLQLLGNDQPLDERHGLIQLRSLAIAYMAVLTVALGGFFWEIAQGEPGAFTLICFIGGSTHILTTVILRRRV